MEPLQQENFNGGAARVCHVGLALKLGALNNSYLVKC
jgi:hypothetical protein